MSNSEALPIVAWRYIEERFGAYFWRLTQSGGDEGAHVQALTLHAQAVAQISALQTQAQQMALDHLASEGQWIELTGKQAATIQALQEEVTALKINADRYLWIREDPGADAAIASCVYRPDWRPEMFDAAIDQARKEQQDGTA